MRKLYKKSLKVSICQFYCRPFDVDAFKHINDTYGHAAGDYALKEVCKLVRIKLKKKIHLVSYFVMEEMSFSSYLEII